MARPLLDVQKLKIHFFTRGGVVKEAIAMCKTESRKECEHPEKQKTKPEEFTPEKIRECHGDIKKHPSVSE